MNVPIASEAEHDQITEAAAHWCMRLHAEDCSPAEKNQFEQWLKAHPLHAAEFQAMQEIWELSGEVEPINPQPCTARIVSTTQPEPYQRRRTYSWVHIAAAAAFAALAVRIVSYIG